jgi:hypothetical protein
MVCKKNGDGIIRLSHVEFISAPHQDYLKSQKCHCEEVRRSNLVAIRIDENARRLPRCARNDMV